MRYTLVAILLGVACWAVWPRAARVSAVGGRAMGVEWSVKVRGGDVGGLREEVAAVLERLEQQMSNYRAGSDLSRFNESASTEWMAVPAELAEVVGRARGVSEMTDGAFDVTIAPVVDAWGFGAGGRRGVVEDVAGARALVGYEQLEVGRGRLRKARAGMRIDLGGIGKGFAADAVGAALDRRGVKDYLIVIGGELRARGTWRVGIESPAGDGRVLRVVELKDASMSTSGDYRNYFEAGGKRYSHEMEPRTGKPVEGALASVTVIHGSGTEADGLATGLFVMGADKGFERAEALGVAAVFVARAKGEYVVKQTKGFASEVRR